MGQRRELWLYGLTCTALLTACAGWAWSFPKHDRGAVALPNLKFACELESRALASMFATSPVITDLVDLGARVSLAVPDLTEERASVVRRLNEAGIPVTAWLLLSKEQGYFFNAENAPAAAARFDEFRTWSTTHGLRWAGVGLDIEPNIEELKDLSQSGACRLVPAMTRRVFDHRRIRAAKDVYQALIERIHAYGYPIEVYQLFFMADERRARSTFLERLLGVVDVSGDRDCLMLHTSFHHSWGASAIWTYGSDAGTIVIGSTGGDSKLDTGFAPLNWDEFIRDVRAARYWTNDIGVYSLEGCVRQGMLARLRSVDWRQEGASPSWRGLQKVRALRAFIAALLYADKYAYVILAFLLVSVALSARALRRRYLMGRMSTSPGRRLL
jgi:hypothetical protein